MTTPLVTIGMPVYNGDEYLAEAVASLLAQTHAALQLIIYDNASTDRTYEVAQSIAARDRRVQVVRHPHPISVAENFIVAAERSTTDYFCWAAHDDLREPEFLATLVALLQASPQAGLATCGCSEIDPDGSFRRHCHATASLAHAQCADPTDRVVAYLRHSPCSPIYGLFRTALLQDRLSAMRQGPRFGGDLVFLAGFLARNGLVFTPAPLLLLRGGGGSHNPDQFESIWHFAREMWSFHAALRNAVQSKRSMISKMRVFMARWKLFARYMTWRPARMIAGGLLLRALPWLAHVHHAARMHAGPFARLRRRLKHGGHKRIAILGAGKHTQRNVLLFQRAIGRHGTIIAIGDDRAQRIRPWTLDVPIVPAADVPLLRPDVLLVSSDTYESALFKRARELVDSSIAVWALYDLSLELLPSKSQAAHRHARGETAMPLLR